MPTVHQKHDPPARWVALRDTEERQQLLPSGKQTTFANRVHWAKTFLGQAGLLEATKRAHFRITDRGRKMLAQGPSRIDNEYLSQFTEFIQFRERNRVPGTPVSPDAAAIPVPPVQTQTPDELLRNTVKQIGCLCLQNDTTRGFFYQKSR